MNFTFKKHLKKSFKLEVVGFRYQDIALVTDLKIKLTGCCFEYKISRNKYRWYEI